MWTPLRTGSATRVALAALLCAGLLSGCTQAANGPQVHHAPPTPIARLNTASMRLPRVAFCNRVPKVAVRSALATGRWRLARYRDGDRTVVAGSTDTVAEDGCAWVADKGAALARAWVFAPPADTGLAAQARRDARTEHGCRVVNGPSFGTPTLTQVCALPKGRTRVRHAGLFGSTWLSCEITDTVAAAVVRKRADAWCVQVANTLNTAR